MLSKTLVNEIFMHYFEKKVSFWELGPQTPTGELPLDPAGELYFLQTPLLLTPGKKSCGRL